MRFLIVCLLCLSTSSWAQGDLSKSAKAFLDNLPEALRKKAVYKLDDAERFNWHFVPKSRNGVALKELDEAQQKLALALLKSSLSAQGYEKSTAIMALENVLRVVENRGPNDNYRDPVNYYVTIFGTPDAKGAWGWRFEGHHVAINFSSVGNRIESSTPSFFGSNPGIVRDGDERGKQVLKMETEMGLELVNLLKPEQIKIALISEEALNEIVSFNSRTATALTPAGLGYKDMNAEQQTLFLKLLDVYVKNYELGFSKKLMQKITKAGIDKLSFAWAGGLKEGLPYYYRVQGPMLLIELDNTQNNANHVHSVVRDLTNDFGEDILKEHYKKEHQ